MKRPKDLFTRLWAQYKGSLLGKKNITRASSVRQRVTSFELKRNFTGKDKESDACLAKRGKSAWK